MKTGQIIKKTIINGDKSDVEKHDQLGYLFIIGGAEERQGDMRVLEHYVALCGGAGCSIAILTSASSVPDKMWQIYSTAFSELGAGYCFPVDIESRAQANDQRLAQQIYDADGIFITGGHQTRLVEVLRGTKVHEAMHKAFKERGVCIGGTSAGASAIARHMLAYGKQENLPSLHTVHIEEGLGFLQNVTIDQHFSERHRLARLLSAIAQNPELIGIGIDEDTALVLNGQKKVKVVGSGAVTLLDGRHMSSNRVKGHDKDLLELVNVVLHLLPAGTCYDTSQKTQVSKDSSPKKELIDTLRLITKRGP